MRKQLLEWCNRHKQIILINILALFMVVIVAILIWFSGEWFFGGSVQTFGPLHSYGFIWLAILIAILAATNTIIASATAKDALELTRNTMRPFLTVSGYKIISLSGKAAMEIIIYIKNSGPLPADSVSVDTVLITVKDKYGTEQELQKDRLVEKAIYFPSIDETLHVVPSAKNSQLILDEKTKIRIIINYRHRLAKESCQTVSSYKIFRSVEGNYLFKPLPEESQWSYEYSTNN